MKDFDLAGKRVLVRVDYNVAIEDGAVKDDFRIRASLPTLEYLLEKNCRIILMSHLGRPEGKDDNYSLRPVVKVLSDLLKMDVLFASDCIGQEAEDMAAKLQPKSVLLLENLRFHPEEEDNDAEFAAKLASLAEIYIDDAFATVHRAHASTVGVAKILPAAAGLLVEQEVETISRALDEPARPLMAIVGGAKISGKIEVLRNLLEKVNVLAIGGAMANTFLAAQGNEVGKSVYEPDQAPLAQEIVAQARERSVVLLLPEEVLVADRLDEQAATQLLNAGEVRAQDYIADLGPKSISAMQSYIEEAGTVIWNGTMGLAEVAAFSDGSRRLGDMIANSSAKTVIAGGDTAAFVDVLGWHNRYSFVSTGGGATLELMAGKQLPGLVVLTKA